MSKEQRVFAHWKSIKTWCRRDFVVDRREDGLTTGGLVYGHYELKFPNEGWVYLARVHKMKVREVKDIVTAERKRRADARGN